MAKLRIFNPTIESLHKEVAMVDDVTEIELIYTGYMTPDIEQAIAVNNYCALCNERGINLSAVIMGICSSVVIVATGSIPITNITIGKYAHFMFIPPSPVFGGSVEEIALYKKNFDIILSNYESLMSKTLKLNGKATDDKRVVDKIITAEVFKSMRG